MLTFLAIDVIEKIDAVFYDAVTYITEIAIHTFTQSSFQDYQHGMLTTPNRITVVIHD